MIGTEVASGGAGMTGRQIGFWGIGLAGAMCSTLAYAGSEATNSPATPMITVEGPPMSSLRALIGDGPPQTLDAAPVIQLGAAYEGSYPDGRGQDDTTCLAQAVYYEARSESLVGQEAVAQVVMNRTRDPRFPTSVCGVVFEQTGRYATCQFSFACDGSMDRLAEPAAWQRAHAVAAQALHGFVLKPMQYATHFHASYVTPYWGSRLIRVGRIGHHIFYQ